MTLIVAAACKGGIVVAADSQVTMGSVRFTTPKLRRLGPRVIWGSAGDVGTTQVIEHELQKHLGSGVEDASIHDLRHKLLDVVNPVQREALGRWLGSSATNPLRSSFLFAGHTAGHAWIFRINLMGESTIHSPDDFSAIGSGEAFAYLARASLAHYDLPNTDLDLASVLLYRAMADIIRTSAHGLAFPISLGQVTAEGVHLLGEQECQRIERDSNYIGELEAEVVRNVFAETSRRIPPPEPPVPGER